MNIVNKRTTRHIQQNKGRTVVTTLGICVSVAMITAVFVAMASFLNLFGEIGLISSGNWDAEFDYLNQTKINQIKKKINTPLAIKQKHKEKTKKRKANVI